jgi:uncharacterized RDD family membrane protein YckC
MNTCSRTGELLSQDCTRAPRKRALIVERTARIATGESVAFDYELAGLGSRCIAVFVDVAIQIGVLVAVLVIFAFISPNVAHGHDFDKVPVSKLAQAIAIALVSFFVFVLFFGYFIVLEWRFGRTPGKALLGIRVLRDGGFPLDFTASVVRNTVRIVEFSLGFYIVSAVSTLLSPFNRRLGDYAAGTIVVRDSRFERAQMTPLRDRPDDVLIAGVPPAERELIRLYAARRATLATAPRDALAARIATSVRPQLAASFDHLSDDDLLVHLASLL